MNKYLVSILVIVLAFTVAAQRGKDGDYTVPANNTVVNTYTPLITSTWVGIQTIEVADNKLNGAGFAGDLQPGDLLLIYHTQGVWVDINDISVTNWGGNYTAQYSFFDENSPFHNIRNFIEFGGITDYWSAGYYEFVEVESIQGNNTIHLVCGVTKSYYAGIDDRCQIIRVPRYDNLNVPAGRSITSPAWNGTTGGVVAVEVDGDLTLNGNINADEKGFRGGAPVNNGTAASNPGSITENNDRGFLGSPDSNEGAEKGESIFGNQSFYQSNKNSRYGYGAIANGGGGGGYHNAGGGGGSNVGVGDYYGYGVVNRGPGNSYDAAWNLEDANLILQPSAGGGRGGYSGVSFNRNPLTVGPHNASWGPDYRRISGGVGGHPLDYDVERIFMGGGGGGGHGNNGYGGVGGNGGGVVLLTVYGDVAGAGRVSANGAEGGSTEQPAPGIGNQQGQTGGDGAGGAGGGGAVMIKNLNPMSGSINLEAIGGKGGDEVIKVGGLYSGFEAHGPGGGGAGGMISYSYGTPAQNVNGGISGSVISTSLSGLIMSNFPVNGATNGDSGMDTQFAEIIEIIAENDTICSGTSTTITPSFAGNRVPGSIRWYNSYHTTTPFYTGNSYTTPNLTATTTYYIGTCDVPYRVPVTIVVAPEINILGTAIIAPETCLGNDGGITGLTATGGEGNLSFDWNGSGSVSEVLAGATSGSYTLTVTDESGCSKTSGPYTISVTPDPVLNITGINIANETCSGNDGGITGITVSGGEAPYTYEWNGNSSPTIDLTGATGGSYTLEVTDANGCSATSGPHTIGASPGPAIDISGLTIGNETCHGNDGSISGIIASGAATPLTFAWNGNSSPSEDISGVSAGTYTLVVTDANTCTQTAGPFTVGTAPVINIDISNMVINDESCLGNDGSISGINVTGGVGALTYSWSPSGGNNLDLTGAVSDDYTLTVSDLIGCTETSGPHSIGIAPPLVLDENNALVADANCGINNGGVTGITISGGVSPYTFEWNGNVTPTIDLANAAPGNYTLLVTDFSGCTVTSASYTIGGTAGPVVDASNVVISDETCHGNDGGITGITVSGGATPLTYDWSGTPSASTDLSGAANGTYTLTVTDVNGCDDVVGPFTVAIASSPTIDDSGVSIIDESCSGNDGSVTGITVSGGIGQLTYDWNGTPSATIDLVNAVGGTYTLTVTDDNGCSDTSGPHTIGASPGPSIDASSVVIVNETCHGNDGSITGIVVTGGTAPIFYSWNGGTPTAIDMNNAPAGSYTLIVADINGCTTTAGPFVIGTDPAIVIDETALLISDESCHGNDGSITGITASGGVGTLVYSWSPSGGTNLDVTGASAGTYTLTVTDDNGCTSTSGPYTISNVPGPVVDVSGIQTANETCDGQDASITGITVTGGTTPITYAWNGVSSSSADLLAVGAGTYTLTITDANGCTENVGPYTLNGAVIPSVNITTPGQEIEYGESVGIDAVASPSGTSINWSPADGLDCVTCDEVIATPEASTWYVVTATSIDGCEASDSIYIKVIDPCSDLQFPTVFSPNGDGLNDTFCILGGCFKYMELTIYNRWGELMFKGTDPSDCWDGTFRGEEVNTGAYVYYFIGTQTDGKEVKYSGNINLIR